MVLDGLGSDDIEVDGYMSQPSDPTPHKRKCMCVGSYSFFCTKKFLEKIFENWWDEWDEWDECCFY